MTNVGVGSWIERRARITPGRSAVISGDRSWSYAEFAARIRRLANAFRSMGVRRTDRVAWVGPNHPAFLESLFAAGQAGAVLAPINHRLEEAAILHLLEQAEPSVVVLERSMEELRPPIGERIVVGSRDPGTEGTDYETLLSNAADDELEVEVGFGDLCMIPFTSGTTGEQKGVMLTHGNVTWNVVNLLSCADFRHDDVTLALAPFFRVGGTGVNVLPVQFMGGTVVVPTSPHADELLGLIERHRVTIGFGNPDLLEALTLAKRWQGADLASVRFIMTGGTPVPERLIRAFLDRGVTILQGYGLSEAAPLVLLVDPADALQKVGAAGKPPLLVEVRIVGQDLRDLGAGETGELLARGPNVMAGYWRRPDATRAAIDEQGWLRTGDAARMDADGEVWIVDRVRDRYVTSGGIVYPGDVERSLAAHPAVAEAGVVGVPGVDGDVGAAFIVLSQGAAATESELLTFSGYTLAEHQLPASITFVEALPRNSVGKLIREALRAWATAFGETTTRGSGAGPRPLSGDNLPEPNA
jgi:acyl-CoA synthetase (AMP-forming)/AMP-acid ligase II